MWIEIDAGVELVTGAISPHQYKHIVYVRCEEGDCMQGQNPTLGSQDPLLLGGRAQGCWVESNVTNLSDMGVPQVDAQVESDMYTISPFDLSISETSVMQSEELADQNISEESASQEISEGSTSRQRSDRDQSGCRQSVTLSTINLWQPIILLAYLWGIFLIKRKSNCAINHS